MPSHRLDRRTGQTYSETTSARASVFSKGPSWVHETPFLTRGWEETNEFGSPSLKHSAMRQTLSDQRNLVPQLFENVPWRIAAYLWDCLGRSRKRTFYMWKVFATAYPDEFRQIAQHRSMKIEGPRLPMRDYLEMVKSENLRWRTVLTIVNSHARVPEMVDVSSVRNLVALEVSTPPQINSCEDLETPMAALSDRIVRTWSELAEGSGGFAHVRVLKLCHQDLSEVALRYLRALPSLQVILVHDCQGIHSVATSASGAAGWEYRRLPGEEGPPTLYELYQTSLTDQNKAEPTLDRDSPILDFQIGQASRTPTRPKNAQTLLLYRTGATVRSPTEGSGPQAKRPKVGVSAGGEAQKRLGPRRPVMKDRKTKDLAEVLGQFF
ncbi:hypothetical protein BDV25DRAFT_158857 [Aspergillus avenaceus]|uniref:Uncharacterized protein n=1 Tax=Aspergillus avenaceus TaxID=36643 RepID=A0A5N6TP72_ASPAV|nr:hypothetical protein BDV25DRAFT_158857 [Aspergillus avenaceus]